MLLMSEKLGWPELKSWLATYGKAGLNVIALKANVTPNAVSRWANGLRTPEAHHVMAVYLATKGAVSYKSAPIDDWRAVWPPEVFQELHAWRARND